MALALQLQGRPIHSEASADLNMTGSHITAQRNKAPSIYQKINAPYQWHIPISMDRVTTQAPLSWGGRRNLTFSSFELPPTSKGYMETSRDGCAHPCNSTQREPRLQSFCMLALCNEGISVYVCGEGATS